MMRLRAPRHRHIMAAAGTGKTFQLTGEYIHRALLELDSAGAHEGPGLAGILATTFTRKAAGEILDRILERLARACLDDAELKSLGSQVAPDLAREDCLRLLARLLSELDRLSIQTLDAFFLRAATGLALDAGLPPGWSIADEDVDAQLREEAMWSVIASEIAGGKGGDLLGLMSFLGNGSLKSSILRPFDRALKGAYAAYLDADCRAAPWNAVTADTMAAPDDADLSEAAATLASAELPTGANGKPNGHWVKARTKLVEQIESADIEGLLEHGLLQRVLVAPDAPDSYYTKPFPDEFLRACRPIAQYVKWHTVKLLQGRNFATRALLDRFHDAYQALKRATGRYTFDDLPRMLARGGPGMNRDAMYFMIDTRLRHVLLDEFQDTSRVQYTLLRPILEELFDTGPEGGAARSVFCVGDVKQSIYAWRNAEPALMPAVAEALPRFERETMHESRRSSPAVIDVVNRVFGGLATNGAFAEHPGAAESWSRHFEQHTAHQVNLAGRVRMRACDEESEGDGDPFATAAKVVQELSDDQPLATVGILVRSRKPIGAILSHLRRLKIDASEESGTSLLSTPASSATISALHLAAFPGDKAAAFHVAAGPIGRLLSVDVGADGVVDAARSHRAAARLRARFASGGIAGVVAWIREGCLGSLTAPDLLRMDQLLDLAESFDARGEGGLADFVRVARARRVEDPNSARVRVMTIHASKGLEFDAVVLPELDKQWADGAGLIVTRRRDVFAPPDMLSLAGNQSQRMCHDGLADAHAKCLDRVIEEEISCLYVAMTRARRALEIVVRADAKAPAGLTAESVLRHALADGPALPGQMLWNHGHGHQWHADFKAGREASRPVTVDVSLVGSRGATPPRTRTESPSSLNAAERSAADIFSTRGERSADEGTLLHAWAESIQWRTLEAMNDDAMLATADEHGVDRTTAIDLLGVFRRSMASEAGDALVASFHDARERVDELDLRREWAFRTAIVRPAGGDAIELAGRIDRLVIGRRGGKAVWADVIDFKSDAVSGDACLQRAGEHAPQMKAYAAAVATMFSLPTNAVGCHVVFIRPGRVVTLPIES